MKLNFIFNTMKKLLPLLIFLLVSYQSYPQRTVVRVDNSDSTSINIRYFNSWYLRFKSPINRNDSIYLGVMSDSISFPKIRLKIFGYFPSNININNMVIILEYEDGTEDPFKLDLTRSNYGEFTIISDLKNISKKRVNKIKFRNFATYLIEDKEYFLTHFKYLK